MWMPKYRKILNFSYKQKKEVEQILTQLNTLSTQTQTTANTVDAKWKNIEQQVENISKAKAQATSDSSATATAKTNAEKVLATIKTDLETTKNTWENNFQELKEQHDSALSTLNSTEEKKLNALYEKYENDLSALNKKYIEEFEKRTDEIEGLLPGATSAGLASAFADRKKNIEKNKIWWAILLLLSVGILITFGVLSLTGILKVTGIASSFSSRIIIVAGLILLEEFARRNFNIISRLAEAYAYKEALAKSYLGYKKQMETTDMPVVDNTKTVKGHSALMKIFLDKLEDEPGKNVFDKEKHYIGPGAIMDKVTSPDNSSTTNKVASELSKGSMLTKISWQIVAVVGIISVAVCVVIFFMRNTIKLI